jgi:isopenicillin N synthase-like dioxygenase
VHKEIPVVDLSDFQATDQVKRDAFIRTVGSAFQDIGFLFVRTPVTATKLPLIYPVFKKFFDLPWQMKAKYLHPEIHHQRGWTAPRSEIGVFCRKTGEGGSSQPDEKENWFMGPEITPDSSIAAIAARYPALYHPNIWPDEVPELQSAMTDLYSDLYGYGQELLRALAAFLDYPESFFDEVIRDSPTVLRALHYPPLKPADVGNVVYGCRHTDINFLTVLPASTRAGLWVMRRDGEWIPGMAPAGCSIVQVGDMLQYHTGGHFLSAHHRVDAPDHPTTEGRYSGALFIHARSDYQFQPDRRWANPITHPPILAADLLLQRLQEIKLAKE